MDEKTGVRYEWADIFFSFPKSPLFYGARPSSTGEVV